MDSRDNQQDIFGKQTLDESVDMSRARRPKHFAPHHQIHFDNDSDVQTQSVESDRFVLDSQFKRPSAFDFKSTQASNLEHLTHNILPEHASDVKDTQLSVSSNNTPDEQENYYDSFIVSDIEESQKPLSKRIGEYVGVVVLAVVIAFFVRTFLFEPYRVPTGSMLETIQLNDTLIGDKLSIRFSKPEPGEIVTFYDPEDPSRILIKRLIATGGQTVDLKNGSVFVDGKQLVEPYVSDKPTLPIEDRWAPNLSGPITYPYTVPQGFIWVMGDNRTNSLDSRYFGSINEDQITSRARFIVWPLEDAKML